MKRSFYTPGSRLWARILKCEPTINDKNYPRAWVLEIWLPTYSEATWHQLLETCFFSFLEGSPALRCSGSEFSVFRGDQLQKTLTSESGESTDTEKPWAFQMKIYNFRIQNNLWKIELQFAYILLSSSIFPELKLACPHKLFGRI